jgi:hypothetical protein
VNGSGPGGEWLRTDEDFWKRVRLPIIGWRLWYADGSTTCSAECSWQDAPREGVQVLVVHHPENRRTIVKGRDEYVLPGETSSKLGLMIEREQFERMQGEAQTDPRRP